MAISKKLAERKSGGFKHNDAVCDVMRRDLGRVATVNARKENVLAVLRDEVVKRDCQQGPAAEEAARRVKRRAKRVLRAELTFLTIRGHAEKGA